MSDYPFTRPVRRPALIDQILVGDHDITNFRGVRTPVPSYRLMEPLGYGAATLTVPQVRPYVETEAFGSGELAWVKKGQPVKIRSYDRETGEVVRTRYRGRVVAIKASGPVLTLEIGGVLVGPASLRNKQVPIVRQVKDIGRFIFDAVENAGNFPGVHFRPRLGPTTGIELTETGGMTHLGWLEHLCAMAVHKNGDQWTCMPRNPGGNVFELRLKDAETVHHTFYLDDAKVVADLVDDAAEHPNTYFVSGVTDEGMIWDGSVFPRVEDGETPAFPGHLEEGDSGEAVIVLNWQLINSRLLARADASPDYDEDTTDAVTRFQEGNSELEVTGEVNEATWNALFDVDDIGWGLDGARIVPQVQDSAVRPYDYTSSGKLAGRNKNYKPQRLRVDRNVAMEAGTSERQGIRWARGQKERLQGKSWVGTITSNGWGAIAGEHNPGDDPPTTGDVTAPEDIWPGENIWLANFDGGTLVHVAEVNVSPGSNGAPDTVTYTVDTHYRDALELSEIIERNRESRRNPRREWVAEQRGSTKIFDAVTPFNEKAGLLTRNVHGEARKWFKYPLFVGGAGTVSKFRIETFDNAAETCGAIFAANLSVAELVKQIGDPFARSAEGGNWIRDGKAEWFDDRLLMYAWGSKEQPGGYWPHLHTNRDREVTGATLNGIWQDDASFGYVTGRIPALWVYVYADRDTWVRRGRQIWAQVEPY